MRAFLSDLAEKLVHRPVVQPQVLLLSVVPMPKDEGLILAALKALAMYTDF